MGLRFRFVAAFFILCSAAARAQSTCCYSNPVYIGIEDIRQYIHRTAVFGEEKRRVEGYYAQSSGKTLDEVQKKFAPTGILDCGFMRGAANLTMKGDLIATAEHILTDRKTCHRLGNFRDCKFKIYSQGHERSIPIVAEVKNGFHCPGPQKGYDDWAILKLRDTIDDVPPLLVHPDVTASVKKGDRLSTAGWSEDFREMRIVHGQTTYVFPKHIQECTIKSILAQAEPYFFKTDCDGSDGSSGSGLIMQRGNRQYLVGLFTNSPETHEQAHESFISGEPKRADYDDDNWFSLYVPVAGVFYSALRDAAPLSVIAAPPPDPVPDKFESEWKICDHETTRGTYMTEWIREPRIKEACDYIIASGPTARPGKLLNKETDLTEGQRIFALALLMRGLSNYSTLSYSAVVDDLDQFIKLWRGNEVWFGDYIVWAYNVRADANIKLARYEAALHDLDDVEKLVTGPKVQVPKGDPHFDKAVKTTVSLMVPGQNDGMRGDIAMATRDYSAAVKYYERMYSRTGNELYLKLITRANALADPSKPAGPAGPPLPPSEACKMYPNLC